MQRSPTGGKDTAVSFGLATGPEELPPNVSNALHAVKTNEIRLKNTIRRLQVKLKSAPSEIQPLDVEVPTFCPLAKARCGKCGPCREKVCGRCQECMVKTVGTCIVDRWCTSWPEQGSKPQLSRCSQTSVATADGVRVVMDKIRHCIGELKSSAGLLQTIVLSTGMRAWRGFSTSGKRPCRSSTRT
jgi:hypothetical protein